MLLDTKFYVPQGLWMQMNIGQTMNENQVCEKYGRYKMENKRYSKAWFDECFEGMDELPDDLRRVSESICQAYGIGGICDPGYIANVIAKELCLGDGLSHFCKR
jgi:hypothetical protein